MKNIFLSLLAFIAVCSCVKDEVFVNPSPEPGPEPDPVPEMVQTLVINELSPSTKKLEFYNYGESEINLGGCSLVKDDTDSWEFPDVRLKAGEVVVFTAKSSNPADGPSFGMSATKGFKLELFNKEGESIDLVDNSKDSEKFHEFVDESDSQETLGRESDGASQWVIFNPGTIGASNNNGTKIVNWGEVIPEPEPEEPEDEGGMVLNELYGAAKEDAGKFIELYNCSGKEIDITGYTLNKDGSLTWTAPEGTVIPGKSFFAIIGAKNSTPGGISSGFSNKKSVCVELFDAEGVKLDEFVRGEEGTGWGNQSLDAVSGSWSRIPDGTGRFMVTEEPTAGEANSNEGTEDETVIQ